MANDTGGLIANALRHSHVASVLSKRPAIALERLARGGGATRWYMLSQVDQLDRLADELSPGSAVSFYFDDRLAIRCFDDETVDLILDTVQAHGEAVVGVPAPDGLCAEVEFVCGLSDLTGFIGSRQPVRMFVGVYPDRDNDGVDAITVDLPDRDGVVRRHPH